MAPLPSPAGPERPAYQAMAFLTVAGRPAIPGPAGIRWFPAVGAALGGALGAVWWAAGKTWPPAVAAAVVVIADLALTGMLHFDGLVDAADGLLPPIDADRRMEVMADPHAGAFGVGTAVATLLLRWATLAALVPSALLLAGLWCASRSVMALTVATVPYARAGGVASAFLEPPGGRLVGTAGLVAGAGLAAAGQGAAGVAAWCGLVAASFAVVALARRRLGGFTGDVLGAAGVVGETAGLAMAAARW